MGSLFSEVADCRPEALLKMKSLTGILKRFHENY